MKYILVIAGAIILAILIILYSASTYRYEAFNLKAKNREIEM